MPNEMECLSVGGTSYEVADGRARQELEKKIDKPSNAPQAGKTLKVLSVNEDGTFMCEWADAVTAESVESALGYVPVKDVKINGTSALTDGVANVPIASQPSFGVTKPYSWGGTLVDSEGRLVVFPSAANHIDARQSRTVIVPENIDYAVRAAMCDGKGAAWTAAEQAVARDRMGLDKPYELIEEIMTDGESIIERTQEPDGTKYSFSHVVVIVTAPKNIQGEPPNIYVLVGMSDKVLSTYATFTEGIPYFKRAQYRAQIERGFASLIATAASISYGTSQYDGNTDGSNVLMSPTIMPAESHFDYIKVCNTLTTVAPAGFLVQIYGVRA